MHEYQILQSLDLWFGGYGCRCANFCTFDHYLTFLPLLQMRRSPSQKKIPRKPGVVFKFLQYLNSATNIYPTATIILKF